MATSSLMMAEPSINVDQVVNQFLEVFDTIRLVAPDDQYNVVGRIFLAPIVQSCVDAGRPIGLVLPAYPAKSPNLTKKVLGYLPDRGEELAFGVLEDFCRDIQKFYPPRAEVVIFSDGRVFSDLLGITSETVATYQEECHRMVQDLGYTILRNHMDIETWFPGALNLEDVNLITSSLAFSKLVQKAYPDMVRISVHAHTNAGPKFGICLIPGQVRFTTSHTPWHNCIVECSDGQIHIMKREMVDVTKYEIYEHLVYNRPLRFKQKRADSVLPEAVTRDQVCQATESRSIVRALREGDAEASQLVKDMIYNEELYKQSWTAKDLVFRASYT